MRPESNYIPAEIRLAVFERANYKCEYCCLPGEYCTQSMVIDHILPIAKGGRSVLVNLAAACGGCNSYKFQKTHGHDPADGSLVPLFNPRTDSWNVHFEWDKSFTRIVGLTPTGRATIKTLKMNRFGLVNFRGLMVFSGKHPPPIRL